MSFRYCTLALAFAATATAAPAFEWTMIPEASTLSFAGTQTGSPFQGQFRRFETAIVFDPADLSTASISVSISIPSFASGSPDRDSDSQNRSWFYASSCQSALKFAPLSASNIAPVCGAGEPVELIRVAEAVRPRIH